jgi:hypothetical protein
MNENRIVSERNLELIQVLRKIGERAQLDPDDEAEIKEILAKVWLPDL